MAHKKAGGSTRNGRDSQSKRLGVKRFGGQVVKAGNIIVQQCRRMEELDYGGEFYVTGTGITQRAGAQQRDQRTQTFASTLDDVMADIFDQVDIGMEFGDDEAIDGLEILANGRRDVVHRCAAFHWGDGMLGTQRRAVNRRETGIRCAANGAPARRCAKTGLFTASNDLPGRGPIT